MIYLPKDDVQKQDILQKIAAKFREKDEYSEPQVNEIINSFDVDDLALVRRELVNFNYLGKDSYKGIYWLKKSRLDKEELDTIKSNQKRMRDKGLF